MCGGGLWGGVHLCAGSSLGVRGSLPPCPTIPWLALTQPGALDLSSNRPFSGKTCCPPHHPLSLLLPTPPSSLFFAFQRALVLSSKALNSVCNYTFISIVSCPPPSAASLSAPGVRKVFIVHRLALKPNLVPGSGDALNTFFFFFPLLLNQ